jgi:DNA-binding transcriptional ArsR family regulator
MEEKDALAGFAALAHEVRLRIIRMLVIAGADGMAAGAIALALDDAPASRISFHLKELEHAGLVRGDEMGSRLTIVPVGRRCPLSSPFSCTTAARAAQPGRSAAIRTSRAKNPRFR